MKKNFDVKSLKSITDKDNIDEIHSDGEHRHFLFENWFDLQGVPNGEWKLKDGDYVSDTKVRVIDECVDYGALCMAVTEIKYLTQNWGTFVEDVSWNSEYECLEVSIGS